MTTADSQNGAEVECKTRRAFDPCLTVLVIVWVVLLLAVLRRPLVADPAVPPQPIVTSIDPSSAPWWELTLLPRIGEIMARRVVEYRESAAGRSSPVGTPAAFTRPEDLARVRGIGPKTVQRMRPYLRFDGS